MNKLAIIMTFSIGVATTVYAVGPWDDLDLWNKTIKSQKYKGFKPTSKHTKECLNGMSEIQKKFFQKPDTTNLPESINHLKYTTIFDQGNLGSCTGNAISGALFMRQMLETRKSKEEVQPASRLFIYYQERLMEGSVKEDAGASIGDGIKVIHDFGAPDEKEWPYIENKFAEKPSPEAYKDAYQHKALDKNFVVHDAIDNTAKDSITIVKSWLYGGNPIVIGINVYESFESEEVAKTGQVPVPDTTKEKLMGGHAILGIGYDDKSETILCANSWGTSWGMNGYFTLPYKYFMDSNLTGDCWVVTTVQK